MAVAEHDDDIDLRAEDDALIAGSCDAAAASSRTRMTKDDEDEEAREARAPSSQPPRRTYQP